MEEISVGIIFGIFLGVFIGIIIGLVFIGYHDEYQDLGGAICDKEYNMTFYSYYDGILKCEPKPILDTYDGLKVKLIEQGGK